MHTGGSTAGRDMGIISEGKRHEDEAKKKFKLHGTHCKWLAGAIFQKFTREARPEIWVRQLKEYLEKLGLNFSDVEG